MRKNRPSRRSDRNTFSRIFGGRTSGVVRKAPRRRDVERLEGREMMAGDAANALSAMFNDPLAFAQWHLLASQQRVAQPNSPAYNQTLAQPGQDINVLPAWLSGFTGSGVQVAILSGGFDLTHEDLVFRNDLGFSLVPGTTSPGYDDSNDYIGTALAGILGATANNGLGGIGVAFDADMIAVRLQDTLGGEIDPAILVQAFTRLAGLPTDLNGDGIVDPITQANTAEILLHAWDFSSVAGTEGRTAEELTSAVRAALETTANLGRPYWDDADGDGILDTAEMDSLKFLGTIHIVPAGNSNGPGTDVAFQSIGTYQSAVYDSLVNSRYTIGVGAIDHGGDYENPETGNVTSWPSISPAVLIVAPAGSSGLNGLELINGVDSGSGLWTTDLSEEDGRNQSPLFGFEFDGDYLGDTNYTSKISATEAAAAQVAGAVALMLEANPELTQREVQYILMASARQADQFSETWITNPYSFFANGYQAPVWASYDFDTDGQPGIEIENGIIPNFEVDPMTGQPVLIRNFFTGTVTINDFDGSQTTQPDFELPIDLTTDDFDNSTGDPMPDGIPDSLVDSTNRPLNEPDPMAMPPVPPVFLSIVNPGPTDPQRLLLFPEGFVDALNDSNFGVYNLTSPASANEKPLQFENGAGFTVSWGMGTYLEEIGYAHGVLDVGLAVQMATLFKQLDFHLPEEVSITTGIQGGNASVIRIQPRGSVDLPDTATEFLVPGGISTGNINTAWYNEWFSEFEATEVEFMDGNTPAIGEIITGAPFFDSENGGFIDLPDNPRGIPTLSIPLDIGVNEDFMSVEWVEFRTLVDGGNIDNLRITLVSPDGTHTELNPVRYPIGGPTNIVFQRSQGAQGTPLPGFFEVIDNQLGGGQTLPDQIAGSEEQIIISLASEPALAAPQPWTFSTNRHWGELLSVAANSESAPLAPDQQWSIQIENWGDGEVTLGQYEVVFHGTQATGTRLQGKIGVDDNAQQILGMDSDELFNFNRYLDFGQVSVDGVTVSVVLDDATDTVRHSAVHDTADPDTGIAFRYAVIDRQDYFDAVSVDPTISGPAIANIIDSLIAAKVEQPLLAFEPTAMSDVEITLREQFGVTGLVLGDPLVFQNFDYSQESFAAGVVVQAEQYAITYGQRTASGVLPTPSAATPTLKVQSFVTGADGNYYFDVDAIPAPPDPANFTAPEAFNTAYDIWFNVYGGVTFEYKITLDNVDAERRIDSDNSGSTELNFDKTYDSSILGYTVTAFADQDIASGVKAVQKDLNFLLKVDPALTNVDFTGTVFRDRNGNGTQQAGLEESIAGVTVFFDANENGTLDIDEASAVTDATGSYSFTVSGLTSTQIVTVAIVAASVPAGLEPLNPADGSQDISVTPGLPSNAVFTLRRIGGEPAQVVGIVFEDIDQDGVRDPGETGFADTLPVRVYIDINNNQSFDVGEPTDLTDSSGQYLIESDTAGTYQIRIVTPNTQIVQTRPAAGAGISVNLVAGQSIDQGFAFGVFDGRIFDYGDLYIDGNHNYPTLLANNGARHVVIPGVRLGLANDIDSDGFQSPVRDPAIDGLGDDYNGVDDEDGVRLVSTTIAPNSTIQFDIMAVGAGALLNAWFDFNNDGDWDDAGEKIFNNVEDAQVLDPLNPQFRRFTVNTPANVDTSATFYAARFRWGSAGIGYSGVANSGEVEDYLFPATAPIVISGNVRNDIDGDGVYELGDTTVAGVRVFFDRDLDGVLDADEPRAITDSNGAYRLEINSSTSLNVTLRLDSTTIPAGLAPLVPVDGIFSQTLAPSATVTSNFLVAAPQGLSGLVFNDADNDGVRDAGENGFANIVVEIFRDADSNGSFETLVTTTATNSQGLYLVPLAAIGQYQVRLNLGNQQFVSQTLPGSNSPRTVGVVNGLFATVGDFGVHDAVPTFVYDYGDLFVGPGVNYPTTITDNGARHTIVAGTRLGTVGPDADPGTLQSPNASADDNLFSPDDEDGVKMASNVAANSDVSIDVTATGTASDRLHAWIDFNDDGDWDDAGERITPVAGLGLTSGVTTRLVINTTGVAVDGTATNYAARFRWGQGITGYTGLASTGEVEDYRLPRLLNSAGLLDGDYNGDGQITLADQVVWRENYGSTINFAADGNRDGVVNAADYTVWRDAYDAAQGAPAQIVAPATQPEEFAYLSPLEIADPVTPAFVTAPELETAPALVTVPPVVTMPIIENALKVTVFDADAFAPMFLASPQVTSILDESLAVEVEAAQAGDAIDAALLQWALGSAADDEAAGSEYSFEEAEEEADEFEEAFASAFAF